MDKFKLVSDYKLSGDQPEAVARLAIDGSPPGSSIHGIFQVRGLEWGAIAFSEVTI